VIARDGRTIHADLALVAPAHPDALFGNVLNAEQREAADVDLLQDEMFALGQLDGHQLMHLPRLFDDLRVLLLAHLAAKLLEVVIGEALHLVLLHLRLVPPLQAVEVHEGA
jgi:hypothetical protein